MWTRGDVFIHWNKNSEKAAVAVIGHVKDFAAYEAKDVFAYFQLERVETNGDKMSENDARALFPQLDDLKYRP